MHILIVNMSEMVTDSTHITISIKYEVIYIYRLLLAYLDLTLAQCKIEDEGITYLYYDFANNAEHL